MIDGFATFLGVQREATLGGSGSGTVYGLDGKFSFTWQPVLGQGVAATSVWRQRIGETSPTKYWQGSFQMIFGHNQIHRLLLESMLETVATQANTPSAGLTTYTYRPRLLAVPTSFRMGVEYASAGPYYLLHGVMIDYVQVTVRLHEVVKVRYEWKALNIETLGGVGLSATATSTVSEPVAKTDVIPYVGGVFAPNIAEFNFALTHRLTPVGFGRNGQPTGFSDDGRLSISGEVVEYFEAADAIPGLLASLGEGNLELRINHRSTVKRFTFYAPRVLFRSGNPDGITKGELAYRAGFEIQHDASIDTTTEARLTLTL